MSKKDTPLLEDGDGTYVVGLVNWMAESLDTSELSKEEALLLFMVLTRAMAALWHSFPRELMILVSRQRPGIVDMFLHMDDLDAEDGDGLDEDSEDDGPDGANGGNGSSGGGQPPLE